MICTKHFESSVPLNVVADVQPLFSGSSGVSGGRNISAIRPQQSVQRKESLRGPYSLDGVGTGAVQLSKPFELNKLIGTNETFLCQQLSSDLRLNSSKTLILPACPEAEW